MAKQAVITAVTAMPGLIASTWAFTTALLANPITWIVVGIIALIAVIILLWQNWESVTTFLTGAWNACCAGVMTGINWLKDGIGGIITWISEKISWFGDCGKRIIETLVGGIKSVASKPVEFIKGIFGKMRKLLPFSDAKEGPLSDLTLSGKRTVTTIAQGMETEDNAPYDALEGSFKKIDLSMRREPIKKVSLKEISKESVNHEKVTERERGVFIDKLNMTVDFKQIKELPKLIKMLKDIEDFVNANSKTPTEEVPV